MTTTTTRVHQWTDEHGVSQLGTQAESAAGRAHADTARDHRARQRQAQRDYLASLACGHCSDAMSTPGGACPTCRDDLCARCAGGWC